MRFLAVAVAALALAGPAVAKPDPLLTLKRQVAALQVQVKQLQAAVTTEQNQRICADAFLWDSLRVAIFPALDRFLIYLTGQGSSAWENIARVDDKGACAAIGVTRP